MPSLPICSLVVIVSVCQIVISFRCIQAIRSLVAIRRWARRAAGSSAKLIHQRKASVSTHMKHIQYLSPWRETHPVQLPTSEIINLTDKIRSNDAIDDWL